MPTYEYDFGWSGLIKLLLKKKVSPECGVKLTRQRKKEYIGDKETKWGMGSSYDETYEVSIPYKCESCGRVYSLKDL